MKKIFKYYIFSIIILFIFTLYSCTKTYNLNKYNSSTVINAKIDKNGKITKPLLSEVKTGEIITFTGVVTGFDIGYDKDLNPIYFYRITPIFKDYTLDYARENIGFGLAVLSPIKEVQNYNSFDDYLKEGEVIELKGSYVNRGDYFTCEELAKENEYTARISYILIEEINIIEDY